MRLVIRLPGRVPPCPRPRVARRGTHMPRRYRVWRDGAALVVRAACRDAGAVAPLRIARVSVALFQRRRQHADLDNQVKSVLDALVIGGALEDDRYVDELCASRYAAEEDYAVVTVRGRRDPWAR